MTYAPAMRAAELTHGWVRLARAGVLGGASLFLATAGHVLGGGRLPGAGVLTLLGVTLALVAVWLTARRLRFGVLLALLVVEQLGLHLALHAATTTACTSLLMPGHAMGATTVCGAGGPAASTGVASGSMLFGHAVAVLATAWLLSAGERWLWRMVERIHRYASARPSRIRRKQPAGRVAVGPFLDRVHWLIAGPRAPPVA